MNCLRCDNHEFARKENAVIEQEFKGEQLAVTAPAMICTKCGWLTVGLDQLDELRRRTADAYRKKHGLLTSDQIRHYRKLLGKNQREFAAFLRVGQASVKRWETWLVQEKSSDELIRAKCEMELRKRLQPQATMPVWVSCYYVKTSHQTFHAEGVQVSLAAACDWPTPTEEFERREEPEPELRNGAADEELALAA